MPKRNKYGAIQTAVDGRVFHSKAESERYCELKLLRLAGKIEGLVCQPKFEAIVNGTKVCSIILDFQYIDLETGHLTYEDVKSKATYTSTSRLKHKLLMALYPEIEVKIVMR